MSAAALPRAKSREPQPHEQAYHEFCRENGYYAVPRGIVSMARAMSHTQVLLYLAILEQTYGAKTSGAKPEYVAFSLASAAEIAGCTGPGASKALSGLLEIGALQSKEMHGHSYYGINLQVWGKLEPRLPRVIERAPKDAEPAEAPAETMVILAGETEPRPLAEVCRCHHDPACQLAEEKAGVVSIERSGKQKAKIPSIEPQVSPVQQISKLEFREEKAKPPDPLYDFLVLTLADQLHELPPRAMVHEIAADLENAGVDWTHFRGLVLAKLRKITGYGLLPALAQDLIAKQREMTRLRQCAPTPRPQHAVERETAMQALVLANHQQGGVFAPILADIEQLAAGEIRHASVEDRWNFIANLEERLITIAEECLDAKASAQIAAEVSARIKPYRGKQTAEQLHHLGQQAHSELVRRHFHLPRLTDFA